MNNNVPGRGETKYRMRLALARKAITDLEATQEPEARLKLMILIERLTSGKPKPNGGKKRQSRDAFGT